MTVFAPNDLDLVQGGPAGRREYLDDVLVARHARLDALVTEVDRILRQRGRGAAPGRGPARQCHRRHPGRVGRAPGRRRGPSWPSSARPWPPSSPLRAGRAYERLAGVAEPVTLDYRRSWDGDLADAPAAGPPRRRPPPGHVGGPASRRPRARHRDPPDPHPRLAGRAAVRGPGPAPGHPRAAPRRPARATRAPPRRRVLRARRRTGPRPWWSCSRPARCSSPPPSTRRRWSTPTGWWTVAGAGSRRRGRLRGRCTGGAVRRASDPVATAPRATAGVGRAGHGADRRRPGRGGQPPGRGPGRRGGRGLRSLGRDRGAGGGGARAARCAWTGSTLVVSADHPAWATQMRHLAPDILARLREVCGAPARPRTPRCPRASVAARDRPANTLLTAVLRDRVRAPDLARRVTPSW